MKWRGRRTSTRVEDRRGRGGGFGGSPMRGGGMKIGGIGAIVILVVGLFLGVDPAILFGMLGGGGSSLAPPADTQSTGPNEINDEAEEFVAVTLADTEEVWSKIFTEMGKDYREPSLVMFSGAVRSACGTANAAMGPFYCPGDRKAYLDTAFFQTLSERLGAKGDFAYAYVIAHEIAHHVQNELGILPEVNQMRSRVSETESNRLSVRIELQADCFSGVWARHAETRFGSLEPGDIEEAMNAASKIGDDALQRKSQGVVVPDSFTHGTSEQRMRWFERGFEGGDPGQCDTFEAERL